jgi:hypothetical protein
VTTNLGVGSSNLSGRAINFNELRICTALTDRVSTAFRTAKLSGATVRLEGYLLVLLTTD